MASVTGESGKQRWRLPEALPALGPVAMRIYIATWTVLLVAAIALPVLGAWFDFQARAHPTWSPYGIGVNRPDGRLEISAVFGASAMAAGLRAGDRIVAIDGQPLPRVLDLSAFRELLVGPEGMTRRFTIIRSAGQPRDVTLARESRNTELRFEAAGLSIISIGAVLAASSLFTSALLVIAAVLLFRQRHRPVAALLSIAYLVLASLSLAGGLAANFLGINAETQPVLAFGWACLLLAIVAMPDGRFVPRWTFWIACIVVLFWAIDGILRLPATVSRVASVVVILVAVAMLGLRYRALAPGPERQQLRWAFLGFAWGSGLIILALIIQFLALTWAAADFRWDTWGLVISAPIYSLGLSAYALGLLVSLLRYRLYDADAAISRSAVYGALTVVLLAIFAGSERIIELTGEEYFGHSNGLLAGGLGAAVAAVMIAPIHHRVSAWAERRFRKDLLHLRDGLPPVLIDLRETAGPDQIAETVLMRAEKGLRATHGAILIGNELVRARDVPMDRVTAWLDAWAPADTEHPDAAKGDPLFPMRVPLAADGIGTVGWLLLGPRPDGSLYDKDEREALAEISAPVARAISVAQHRMAWQQEQASVTATLAKRIGQLEQAFLRAAGGDHRLAVE